MKAKKTAKKLASKKTAGIKKVSPVAKADDEFLKAIAKMKADKEKRNVKVAPTVDPSGVVTMKSVDDPGETSDGTVVKVNPRLDKETGVVTMVPDED